MLISRLYSGRILRKRRLLTEMLRDGCIGHVYICSVTFGHLNIWIYFCRLVMILYHSIYNACSIIYIWPFVDFNHFRKQTELFTSLRFQYRTYLKVSVKVSPHNICWRGFVIVKYMRLPFLSFHRSSSKSFRFWNFNFRLDEWNGNVEKGKQ